MTSPADRQNDAIALGEFIATLEGKHVKVSQAISWRPGTDFERHSTVHMQFVTLVERTSWAMSGGHFMLYGKDGSSYAVGTTKVLLLSFLAVSLFSENDKVSSFSMDAVKLCLGVFLGLFAGRRRT